MFHAIIDKHSIKTSIVLPRFYVNELKNTLKVGNPSSVMGATKRLAEMIVQSMNNLGKTKFITVRFGNVLGSNGSVVPLFVSQIKRGGPVTVTHKEMIRYFMTIPEASSLVLQAASLANDEEIFILDMGVPVKIDSLARKMIILSGMKPNIDIEITYTGLRPGEKLFEELLVNKNSSTTKYDKIFIENSSNIDYKDLMCFWHSKSCALGPHDLNLLSL